MAKNVAFKATYHFYFVTEVLSLMKERKDNTGDLFGYGEDDFVTDLYPYSNLIYRTTCSDLNPEYRESDIFELMKECAESFWSIIDTDNEAFPAEIMETKMPDIGEFELDVKRAISRFEAK